VEACAECGLADWVEPPMVRSRSYGKETISVATIVLIVFGMAAAIAGLWSFFAFMHRMWKHS
jgi:hypothetical protein